MLDQDLQEQLKQVFANLTQPVQLVADQSEHGQQAELMAMLEAVAASSPSISVVRSGRRSEWPRFEVFRSGAPIGISFVGIPGGHEFSSLILAILNAGGLGRLPDPGLATRIQRLRGDIKLRTFISLSCENCPDVVQALNQIALTHGALSHEMIDGAFVQDELSRLNIQGVPSVMIGSELLHSGRASLVELLSKLEERLGTAVAAESAKVDLGHFDVAVLGGGPAGVSAAIYSARKGLKTVLIADKLGGQLQQTKGIENMFRSLIPKVLS